MATAINVVVSIAIAMKMIQRSIVIFAFHISVHRHWLPKETPPGKQSSLGYGRYSPAAE
jgi:hypothetical protein